MNVFNFGRFLSKVKEIMRPPNPLQEESKGILAPAPLARPMQKANMGNDRVAAGSAAIEFNKVMANVDETEQRNVAKPTDPVFERIPGPNAAVGDRRLNIPPQGLGAPVISEPQTDPIGIPTPAATPAPSSLITPRMFFTGTLGVGKDYVANQIGAKVYGFADPIYALATHFFGVEVNSNLNKDLPGMRKFMQVAGQYGRRVVNEQYPFSADRATFIAAVRAAASDLGLKAGYIDWHKFGTDENYWVNGLLSRVTGAEEPLIANTNVRFDNEFKALTEAGFGHWHVVCSPQTLQERLAKKNLNFQSPELNDISEQLAKRLNDQVKKALSAGREGSKLRVIWNDHVPCPSPRLWTLVDFCAEVAKHNTSSNLSII